MGVPAVLSALYGRNYISVIPIITNTIVSFVNCTIGRAVSSEITKYSLRAYTTLEKYITAFLSPVRGEQIFENRSQRLKKIGFARI